MAINNYGIVSCSSNININNSSSVISGYGDLSLTPLSNKTLHLNNNKTAGDLVIDSGSSNCNVVVGSGGITLNDTSAPYITATNNDFRITTASNYILYLNINKTYSDLVLNSGSSNCNVVGSGNLLIGNTVLNPLQAVLTTSLSVLYLSTSGLRSTSYTFLLRTKFPYNAIYYLDICPGSLYMTFVNQSPAYTLTLTCITGFNFYGKSSNTNTLTRN